VVGVDGLRERIFPLIKRPTPVMDALGTRGAGMGWRPGMYVRGATNPGYQYAVHGVDGSLDAMKARKVEEWKARGYSQGMIDMALSLADDWALSMSTTFAPPEVRDAAMRMNYPKGLEVADRWISKMAL